MDNKEIALQLTIAAINQGCIDVKATLSFEECANMMVALYKCVCKEIDNQSENFGAQY